MKTIILTGGTSTEREVSIKSANFFKKFWPKNSEIMLFPEDLEKFLKLKNNFDLAIPVFHWKYGEDGMIFAFFFFANSLLKNSFFLIWDSLPLSW